MVTPQKAAKPAGPLIWFGEQLARGLRSDDGDFVIEFYQDPTTHQVYHRWLKLGREEWWTVPLSELHL